MADWTDYQSELTGWREAGEGEAVVFLHGLGGTRSAWGPQLDAMSDSRRCIAWDMPGYGASAPEANLTYSAIAERLVAFLDELELERVYLVGLSFGGMHALHTALRHPERVRRMVLSNTSPAFGMNGTTPQDWKAQRLGPIDNGETPATMAPRVLDAIVGRPLEPSLRDDLLGAFGRISVEGFRAAVECLPHNDIRDQLDQLEHECLVIVGDLDQETPMSYAKVLADGLPNSEFVVLEGVGHLSPSEDPDTFNRLTQRFLDG